MPSACDACHQSSSLPNGFSSTNSAPSGRKMRLNSPAPFQPENLQTRVYKVVASFLKVHSEGFRRILKPLLSSLLVSMSSFPTWRPLRTPRLREMNQASAPLLGACAPVQCAGCRPLNMVLRICSTDARLTSRSQLAMPSTTATRCGSLGGEARRSMPIMFRKRSVFLENADRESSGIITETLKPAARAPFRRNVTLGKRFGTAWPQ
mmetsp:Transcript_29947/g.67955  ORF Transcript_29947/g.67955 Transcript_29947/m.67955 type:complete len:207 (-) Transcript_29947:662-1282(-)